MFEIAILDDILVSFVPIWWVHGDYDTRRAIESILGMFPLWRVFFDGRQGHPIALLIHDGWRVAAVIAVQISAICRRLLPLPPWTTLRQGLVILADFCDVTESDGRIGRLGTGGRRAVITLVTSVTTARRPVVIVLGEVDGLWLGNGGRVGHPALVWVAQREAFGGAVGTRHVAMAMAARGRC